MSLLDLNCLECLPAIAAGSDLRLLISLLVLHITSSWHGTDRQDADVEPVLVKIPLISLLILASPNG